MRIGISGVACLSILGAAVMAGSAFAAPDFSLRNESGSNLCYLYISPAGENRWQQDLLGPDCLAPNEAVRVTFSPEAKGRKWDVRIEDDNEGREEYPALDLDRLRAITILGNGKARFE